MKDKSLNKFALQKLFSTLTENKFHAKILRRGKKIPQLHHLDTRVCSFCLKTSTAQHCQVHCALPQKELHCGGTQIDSFFHLTRVFCSFHQRTFSDSELEFVILPTAFSSGSSLAGTSGISQTKRLLSIAKQ